jgi:antirestriction protein ArdC
VKPKAAGYLKSWLSALDFKPEYLIQTAANAYKVFDFFFSKQDSELPLS